MLEEKDGIVATDRGPEQPRRIQSIGREHHPQTGNVSENAFSTLRVINCATSKVAANGHANHTGRGERVVGAPADQRQFVTKLHHGGPDVVEELDFHYRLEPARSHASGAAHDVGFCDGRVEYAVRAEVALQPGGQLEHAAFSLDQLLL